MLFGLGRKKRILGIGLDGFPYSLARKLMDSGRMPNLKRLAEEGSFKQIHSVYPTVSNVAWASFQTGKGPGEFGVYGFIELRPDLDLYIPNATDLKQQTIWTRLSDRGKRVVALSVPMTYPAPQVNGLLVSGFLAPRLDERAVSSPDVLQKLRWTQYEIDVDPATAHRSLDEFQDALTRVSTRRRQTALSLMGSEPWDLFFLHVMDTDRINHFMWSFQHQPEDPRGKFFFDFYGKVDEFLGRVAQQLDRRTGLLVLSDHGFCELKWEVQLNRWLRAEGYLDYENAPDRMFKAVKRGSRAVSLVPGRIHLLTKWGWEVGSVSDLDYESLRSEIMEKLRELRHPETGESVCRKVMTRQEAFSGPHLERAPDIVIDPCNGYDLKARMGEGELFGRGVINGMHTYDDAMLLASKGLGGLAQAGSITEAGALLARHFVG